MSSWRVSSIVGGANCLLAPGTNSRLSLEALTPKGLSRPSFRGRKIFNENRQSTVVPSLSIIQNGKNELLLPQLEFAWRNADVHVARGSGYDAVCPDRPCPSKAPFRRLWADHQTPPCQLPSLRIEKLPQMLFDFSFSSDKPWLFILHN